MTVTIRLIKIYSAVSVVCFFLFLFFYYYLFIHFRLKHLFATVTMPKFKDERFYFRNSRLHVCPAESFILDSRLANYVGKNCPFGFLLVVFDCGSVAFSASFFPFGVLDGR